MKHPPTFAAAAAAALTLASATALAVPPAEVSIDEADVSRAAPSPDFVQGQYIVVLRHGARGQAVATRHGVGKGHDLTPQRAVVLHRVDDARLRALAADPDVEAIYPDAIAHMDGKPVSAPAPQTIPTGVDRIGADEIANRGAGVVVCITDTGIDYRHADLAANYDGGRDFINNDADPLDDNGHGTHVAGTIAAVDNATDVIGVAPQARLLAAKVLDRRGNGSYSAITAGVNYCVAAGATVINMSLGGTFDDPTLHQALVQAKAAGVTIVVAAGNSGVNLDTSPRYPASYDDAVITVSAVWIADGASAYGSAVSYPTFSNYGSVVDLSAPGTYVVSDKRGGGVTTMSGTSMAAPHVAGGVALYIAGNPGATPDAVRDTLVASAENVNHLATRPENMLDVRGL